MRWLHFSPNKKLLDKYYRIPTPAWEITRFAAEKKLTYQLAEQFDIPVPATHYPQCIEQLEEMTVIFPVILKPSVKEPFYSLTKKKAIQVTNRRQLLAEFNRVRNNLPRRRDNGTGNIPRAPESVLRWLIL
jgi:predicted ATP-grasp superfamily ATP-dependent carboligase